MNLLPVRLSGPQLVFFLNLLRDMFFLIASNE